MSRGEEILLGTIIAYPETVEAAQRLRPTDFTGTNRDLFEKIQYLWGQESLSYRALVETLQDDALLFLIGDNDRRGEDYLRYLVEQADRGSVNLFVSRVEESAIRRTIEEFAGLLAVSARDTNQSLDEVIATAETKVFDLRRRSTEDNGLSIGEIIGAFMPRVEGMRNGSFRPAWVPPIQALKNLVDYVDRTELVILAGRPGEGKSSVMRFDALKTTINDQHVTTFNLENDELEYAKYALAAMANIDSAKLKSPRLMTEREMEYVRAKAEEIANLPWKIITLSSPSIANVINLARKACVENRTQLIQLDYLQLIRNGNSNRVEDLSETTGLLRGLALKQKVPVVAACQLNRTIELRGDNAEPQLSDLRESGSIEQDATQVWFVRSMWRNPPTPAELATTVFPENYDRQGQPLQNAVAIPVRFHVKKNRNGPVGRTEPIKWRKDTGVFQTLTRENQ
jgi:replicative DNA helicase